MPNYGYLYKDDEQIVDLNNPAPNREIILKIALYGDIINLNKFLVPQADHDPNNEENPDGPNLEFPQNLINNLVEIETTFNKIEVLPLLTPLINLKNLHVNSNKLITLPNLPTNLISLNCSINNLLSLPNNLQSIPSLNYLYIHGNQLTELPELPPNLIDLTCSDNNIKKLPNLPNTLTKLVCGNNPNLIFPSNLPNKLKILSCDRCNLKTLPKLPITLTQLLCGYNNLQTLSELPPNISELNCSNNNIKKIENLPDSLNKINFDGNIDLNYDALIKIIKCYRNIERKIGQRYYTFAMDIQVSHYMERAKKMNEIGWITDLSLRRQHDRNEESRDYIKEPPNGKTPPPEKEPLPDEARYKVLEYLNSRLLGRGGNNGKRKTKNRKNKKLHRKTKTNKRSKISKISKRSKRSKTYK